MLPPIECIVFGSDNVDALTVTGKTPAGRAMLAGLYNRFAEENEQLAYQESWKALGYKGFQSGSVRYGTRRDSSALFSSGDDAMKITHMLVFDYDYLELNVTRIDLCVDIALREPVRGWLRRLRDSDNFTRLHARQKRDTRLIESTTGDTLYIGNRESPRFGRIYDKSAHYQADLGSVYRFEIETKRNVSQPVFNHLFPEKEDSTFSWGEFIPRSRSIIKGQFGRWGVVVDLDGARSELIRAEARISTMESQLQWLSTSVSPMLQKLMDKGYKQQVFDALGLNLEMFPETVVNAD